jgi:hypothetical protein
VSPAARKFIDLIAAEMADELLSEAEIETAPSSGKNNGAVIGSGHGKDTSVSGPKTT